MDIPNKSLATRTDDRVQSYRYGRGSVKGRAGQVVDIVEEITEASIVLNNGDQVLNQSLVTANSKERIIVSVERATYVGSVSAVNLLPLGSAVDESQWQVIGPFNGIYKIVGSAAIETEEYENANQLYVRNISAGTVTVIFQHRVKYIVNGGSAV